MVAKVVGLRGERVAAEGQPDPHVVEFLETLLADAKSGHLHAIAAATDYQQGVRYAVVGTAMGFDMIGGLERAKHRIMQLMDGAGNG